MYEPSGKVTKNQGKFREKSGKNQGIYTPLFGGHPVYVWVVIKYHVRIDQYQT